MMVLLQVPGQPVAKARPRVTRSGRTYTEAGTKRHQAAIRAAYLDAGGPYFPGPVEVEVICWFARPKTAAARKKQPMGDVDNLLKTVMDALNPDAKSGFRGAWPDDRNVAKALVRKCYVGSGEKPYTTVCITPLNAWRAVPQFEN